MLDAGPSPVRAIAIVNSKGGCGKTTTAVNLAACLGVDGSRTLLVDVDSQGYASEAVGVDPRAAGTALYDLLVEGAESPAADRAVVRVDDGLDLLPGGVAMSILEQGLRKDGLEERTANLARVVSTLGSRYDYVVIDTPPNGGILTLMALRAAREVIVPLEMSSFAVRAATRLLEMLEILGDRLDLAFGVRMLPTLYDGRTRFARATLGEIRELAGHCCFDVVIRRSVVLAEAAKRGVPVGRCAPRSIGAADYAALAAEVDAYHFGPVDREAGVERVEYEAQRGSKGARPAIHPEAPTFVRSSSVTPPNPGSIPTR